QAATGADVLTSPAAQPVLQTGMADLADPQFGMHEPMTPVPVVGVFGLGNHYGYILDRVGLGMIETPGHTLGALTWTWESCDDTGDCKTIVYADSMSPVSSETYRFSDHPEYVAAYRAGIARVAELDCDILLTPHPSASEMRDKLLADDLTSGMNCRQYAASTTERLNERLAQEAATQ
ncbi:MAG TPA: hypothetical protein VLA45_05145, partial [Paracoccaceae bacterium]|nr:hypothetical protein [Paracoccaceae bacterium]